MDLQPWALTDSELARAIEEAEAENTPERVEALRRERDERAQLRATMRGYDPWLSQSRPGDAT